MVVRMWKKIALGVMVTCLSASLVSAATVTDGVEKWELPLSQITSPCPALGPDGTIYVAGWLTHFGPSDYFYAVDPDGTQKWQLMVGSSLYLSSPALGPDGTIYLRGGLGGALSSSGLFAVNPDGTLKWDFPLQNVRVAAPPAIGVDGTIYAPGADGKLYALNPDGTQKWAFQTGYDSTISQYPGAGDPVIGKNGTIYVKGYDGKLYAVNPDGTEKWEFATYALAGSPAIGADGTIYIGGVCPFSPGSPQAMLFAVNPNGTQKWAFGTGFPGGTCSNPGIGRDGTIYVGADPQVTTGNNQYGKFFAINPNGAEKWEFSLTGYYPSCPAIGADNTIYFAVKAPPNYNGVLCALNRDGSSRWEFQGDSSFGYPSIGNNGAVYVCSLDKLYAISTTCGGLARTPWPKYRHDAGNTGRDPKKASPMPWISLLLGPL
jgi:outer membrane protein assembly factor BamB